MTTNDLTAPLGQGPRNRRRTVNIPAAQIIAVALGLFLGLFVLWAVVGRDPSGGEPIAVAPADLRIAKKAPELCVSPASGHAGGFGRPGRRSNRIASAANKNYQCGDGDDCRRQDRRKARSRSCGTGTLGDRS
jgi:hypothetical protein